mmetsp:Transcript_20106/g.28904  ORF Transcript_20106/g.28904 Transcript_20106/m.28904 type:complete len:377 (-) Transcript_20106:160-1290(-)|eukprot:CAMPEP_0185039748 /NCGR_PEP_ID=MMETSP1103-20130426/36973_1 /TAXON_ID=36769 /ORGANISM="Paraphysomonas bandaiensis, Strain Caron Lab Isolate" /LENGTH=376 /DNA_ID=CAMNT_0027578775 /DNA_START=68 /DNA_END=1198 /DNA_ORIENTATION=+
MGNSAKYTFDADVPGRDELAAPMFEAINISKSDLNFFYAAFADMDSTNCGNIRLDEILMYYKIEKNPFTMKLFQTFDVTNDGYLNFCEFVCSIWNILSLDPLSEDLCRFIFKLYDENGVGYLNNKEVHTIMDDIHQSLRHQTGKYESVLTKSNASKERKAGTTLENFIQVAKETPSLMAPVVKFQCTLRRQLLGVHHWEKLTIARAETEGHDSLALHAKRMAGYCDAVIEKEKFREMALSQKKRKEAEENEPKYKNKSKIQEKRRTSEMLSFFNMKGQKPAAGTAKPQSKIDVLPQQPRPRKNSLFKPRTVKKQPNSCQGKGAALGTQEVRRARGSRAVQQKRIMTSSTATTGSHNAIKTEDDVGGRRHNKVLPDN